MCNAFVIAWLMPISRRSISGAIRQASLTLPLLFHSAINTVFRVLKATSTARVFLVALTAIVPTLLFVGSSAQEPAAPAGEAADTRIYVCGPDGSGMKPLVEKTEFR